MSARDQLRVEVFELVRRTHDEAARDGMIACPRLFATLMQDISAAFMLQELLLFSLTRGEAEAWQAVSYERFHTAIGVNAEEFHEGMQHLIAQGFIESWTKPEGQQARVCVGRLLDVIELHLQDEGGAA